MRLSDEWARRAAVLLAGGMQLAISVAVMGWLGTKLDAWAGSGIVFTLIGTLGGFASGFGLLIRSLRRLKKKNDDDV